MKRFKMIIAYDGTNYSGFARQPNAITIQEVLEGAIKQIVQEDIKTLGAGRTDTQVHAKGQCVTFDSETKIPPEKLLRAINSRLPQDIVIREIEEVSMDFQPRYGAKRKTYRYQILNSKIADPFLYKYTMQYPYNLDIEKMREAANVIVGEHDFKCFCSSGSSVKDTVREIYSLNITRDGDIVNIEVCGNGFLYNMVRIIVGTLLWVNEGKITPKDIEEMFITHDRKKAGPTAPPQGLTMMNIEYL